MNLKAIYKIILFDFRLHVAFTLFLIWLLAVWHFRTLAAFGYPILAVGLITILDLGITWVRDHKIYLHSASFVTGLLIGLIIAPNGPVWIVAVACLLASLSKQFIKLGLRQHIFNPAAFGVMATSLIFGISIAWWGIAWSKWPLMILIPLMARILWRMKRLMLPITFLVVFFLFLAIKVGPQESIKALFDGSVMLFALVMLPEPITSPNKGYFNYLFGVLVAIISILISSTKALGEVFLPALLFGNLIGFLLIRFKTFAKAPTSK